MNAKKQETVIIVSTKFTDLEVDVQQIRKVVWEKYERLGSIKSFRA